MTKVLPLANRFLLEGDGMEVEIAPSIEGGSLLHYHSGTTHADFSKDDVAVEESLVGTRYTVTLAAVPDLGSTMLSVLLPTVHVPVSGETRVRTVAITARIKTGLFPGIAPGQDQTYTAVNLRGTASYIAT